MNSLGAAKNSERAMKPAVRTTTTSRDRTDIASVSRPNSAIVSPRAVIATCSIGAEHRAAAEARHRRGGRGARDKRGNRRRQREAV